MRKLRQENGESFRDTKLFFNRLESSVSEIKQQMEKLDERVTAAENRVSAAEDRSMRQERVMGYLLRRDVSLAAKCDDLENRLRRNNIRLYGIIEGAEKSNMLAFITDFLQLDLQTKLDIKIERAHRALAPKPQDAAAPPRSIIVRFLDSSVKQAVLQQAWKQQDTQFQGWRVYFDQDYSPDLQRKRKLVQEVIKKLRKTSERIHLTLRN